MPDVLMPRLSDTMEEGTLSQWLKNVGDAVHKGDVLAEIETDKATMDLESFEDGVLERQLVSAGASVPIGQPIAVIGEVSAPRSKPELRTSPLARKLARDHDLDLAVIDGSGPQGRITRVDVEEAIAQREAKPAAAGVSAQGPASEPLAVVAPMSADGGDEVVPLGTIRRIAARRLSESQAVPHFFLTALVDVEALIAFRAEINAGRPELGTKVSINDLVVRACAVALRAHSEVNASWGGDVLLLHRHVNIGIAVSTPAGLVPVVVDADRK